MLRASQALFHLILENFQQSYGVGLTFIIYLHYHYRFINWVPKKLNNLFKTKLLSSRAGLEPMLIRYRCFIVHLSCVRYCSSQPWETLSKTGRCIPDFRGYILIKRTNTNKLQHEHHEQIQSIIEYGEWLEVCENILDRVVMKGCSEEVTLEKKTK